MKLTKQQTIEEHRRMWNWIADEYTAYNGLMKENSNAFLDIRALKQEYCSLNNIGDIENNCFCCQYCADRNPNCVNCKDCPLIWVDKYGQDCIYCNGNIDTLYETMKLESMKILVDTKKCENIARQIANLKEKINETH